MEKITQKKFNCQYEIVVNNCDLRSVFFHFFNLISAEIINLSRKRKIRVLGNKYSNTSRSTFCR